MILKVIHNFFLKKTFRGIINSTLPNIRPITGSVLGELCTILMHLCEHFTQVHFSAYQSPPFRPSYGTYNMTPSDSTLGGSAYTPIQSLY